MSEPIQPYLRPGDDGWPKLVMPGEKSTFTEAGWAALRWPPCPTCGSAISVDRVDISSATDWPERAYMAGYMKCPNDCDPRLMFV
jgi:hypothetical protein